MICTHAYITLRCEGCGSTFGDEYEYGSSDKEQDRIRMDALAKGWSLTRLPFAGGEGVDLCPKCHAARDAAELGTDWRSQCRA